MEWKDRVKQNPYLKKLIIDGEEKIVEIREVDENIVEDGTPLNAENMQNLDDRITNLIDSGSNSNGHYIKYADGTMIQYGGVSITVEDPREQGGLTYYSGAKIIDFPQSFINNNYQTFTNIIIANMNYFAQSYAANISNSQVTISFATTGSNETRTIQWIAIGRWK